MPLLLTQPAPVQAPHSTLPATAPAPCTHCGAPCTDHALAQGDDWFCCTGCATVHQLLAEGAACPAAPPRTVNADEFRYLDDPALTAELADHVSAECVHLRLEVPGMHCGTCVWVLEAMPRFQPGIVRAVVDLGRRQLTVEYNPGLTQLSAVVALLTKLGYPPRLNLDAAAVAAPASDAEAQQLLLRLGVAGFCLGNLMLLSFPDYLAGGAALAPQYQRLFGWISLLLALPLFFYAGGGYLRSAWRGLRHRYFHIDQPLALGMSVMFLRSAWEIGTGTGMGYLDSLAGLVFFLLLGKWFQARSFRVLAFDRDYRAYFPLAVSVLRGGAEQRVPVRQVVAGDVVVVRAGEIVPADAELLRGAARIDNSFLTGESAPVAVAPGGQVLAGGRQTGGQIELRVLRPVSQSRLTRLWNHPAFRKAGEGDGSRHERLVHVFSKWLTVVTVGIAVAALAFWAARGDWERGIHAATAVLIVICPCSLAFAAPFAFGHVTRILGRLGFYLKHAQTVETLARLHTLVFDKTGTLTQAAGTHPIFCPAEGFVLDDVLTAAVAAVARQSAHPLSQTLAQALPVTAALTVTAVAETPGEGVAGVAGGRHLHLGSPGFCGMPATQRLPAETAIHLQVDGCYAGCFVLAQAWRAGTDALLTQLRKNYRLLLVSGDAPAAEGHLRPWFGELQWYRQRPKDKLARILAEQQPAAGAGPSRTVAMVGDGLNDAGALRQADCGIAVTEHAGLFTPGADAILAAAALPLLPRMLALARGSLRTVYTCFAVALAYNLAGAYYAVQGELSPVVAAVLMPAVSIGTIGLATGLSYAKAQRLGLW